MKIWYNEITTLFCFEHNRQRNIYIEYSVFAFLFSSYIFIDDFESAKILLKSKDKFSKLSGEELKQIIPSGWIEQEWYFKTSSSEYEKVAHYTGIIKLESNGTGRVETPGNETIDWFIDENNLYIKTNTNSEKISKDDKYKYDVCRLDDETLICFGQNDVFLLISNLLLK